MIGCAFAVTAVEAGRRVAGGTCYIPEVPTSRY